MNINTYRFCHQAKLIFIYYLENINKIPLNLRQQEMLESMKLTSASWVFNGGYFDKTLKSKIIEYRCQPYNYLDLFNSTCFKKFSENWYNLLINRDNPEVFFACTTLIDNCFGAEISNNFKNQVFNRREFNKPQNREETINNFGHLRGGDKSSILKYANNKKCLIINNFADLMVEHYNSGKVNDFYKLIKSKGLIDVVPNFKLYSFKTEFPLLNGKNVKENNFFEMLDKLLIKLEKIYMEYDFFFIACGVYSTFIGDFLSKHKKDFAMFGRELQYIFLIKTADFYKHNQSYNINETEPYLFIVPEENKPEGCEYLEDGNLWGNTSKRKF